jgi:hypothetical protein
MKRSPFELLTKALFYDIIYFRKKLSSELRELLG